MYDFKKKIFLLSRSDGFTFIEVIGVLVILGVIAAVTTARISTTDSYNLVSEADILKTNLRFAQSRAMNDEFSWGIAFTANSYTLLRNGATATINLPNDSSATHTFPTGVSITSGNATVTFDNWGSPGINPISITLNGSQTITVTRNTGFIP